MELKETDHTLQGEQEENAELFESIKRRLYRLERKHKKKNLLNQVWVLIVIAMFFGMLGSWVKDIIITLLF